MDKSDFIKWAKKLRENYRAGDHVYEQLSNIDLIALVGPTGVGKSTILDNLGVHVVLSDVTRPMRPGEKNGKDYHFREDYLKLTDEMTNGDFIQFLVSNSGEFYGTKKSSYPKKGYCTMAVVAKEINLFRELGFRKVLPIYIMPPGYTEWMRRIGANRHRDIHARIDESIESIRTALDDPEYSFVLNDNVDLAIRDINNIIKGNPVDEHRTRLAKETADVLLERLGHQDEEDFFN